MIVDVDVMAIAVEFKYNYGPAADWFLDHHPMDLNQSGDFVDAGKPFTCRTSKRSLLFKVRWL